MNILVYELRRQGWGWVLTDATEEAERALRERDDVVEIFHRHSLSAPVAEIFRTLAAGEWKIGTIMDDVYVVLMTHAGFPLDSIVFYRREGRVSISLGNIGLTKLESIVGGEVVRQVYGIPLIE